jgi:hypothetical protein
MFADSRPSLHLQAAAAEHLGAFLREPQNRGAAIAHRLAGRLPGEAMSFPDLAIGPSGLRLLPP